MSNCLIAPTVLDATHCAALASALTGDAQDNVPAFASSEAVAIIERNLGGKLLDKFESFDMQPIAAASLGQVTHPSRL